MTEFFDKLRTDRKLDECLKLADQISDPSMAGRLKALLALHFAEIQVDLPVFQGVIGATAAPGSTEVKVS